jgi:hypothetical protein
MSKASNLRIRLKSPIKREVNGEILREPGIFAEFSNHMLTTADQKLIGMLRHLLTKDQRIDYWNRLFQERPSAATIEKMRKATAEIQSKIDAAREAAVGKEGVKQFDTFEKFKSEQARTQGRVVEGMRGVHNG